MRMATTIAAACAAGLFAAPAAAAENGYAQLIGPDGKDMGLVTLSQSPNDGVLIQVQASGLKPGEHGFHIHQVSKCQPTFQAAGGHYNPDGHEHGFLVSSGYHAGDLPNIYADQDGMAVTDHFHGQVSLKENAPSTLFDENGSAFIVHENADTYEDKAKVGGRVACGVIKSGTPQR